MILHQDEIWVYVNNSYIVSVRMGMPTPYNQNYKCFISTIKEMIIVESENQEEIRKLHNEIVMTLHGVGISSDTVIEVPKEVQFV